MAVSLTQTQIYRDRMAEIAASRRTNNPPTQQFEKIKNRRGDDITVAGKDVGTLFEVKK